MLMLFAACKLSKSRPLYFQYGCVSKLWRKVALGYADPVYPPSLYRAVSYVSTLGVPVYILENGMPSKQDDERRTEWIDGCMAEVGPLRDLDPHLTVASSRLWAA
jgi:hypothetical protein